MIRGILEYIFGSILVGTANTGSKAAKKYEDKESEITPQESRPLTTATPWSIGEVNYLKANHDSYTVAEMAGHLERTPESVRSKLRRMKVPPSYWEKDEDEYLLLHHTRKPHEEIAEHLGRHPEDVAARVLALGIDKEN